MQSSTASGAQQYTGCVEQESLLGLGKTPMEQSRAEQQCHAGAQVQESTEHECRAGDLTSPEKPYIWFIDLLS